MASSSGSFRMKTLSGFRDSFRCGHHLDRNLSSKRSLIQMPSTSRKLFGTHPDVSPSIQIQTHLPNRWESQFRQEMSHLWRSPECPQFESLHFEAWNLAKFKGVWAIFWSKSDQGGLFVGYIPRLIQIWTLVQVEPLSFQTVAKLHPNGSSSRCLQHLRASGWRRLPNRGLSRWGLRFTQMWTFV